MPKTPSDKVRHCYQRAIECRQKAMQSRDRTYKRDMLEMEESWLRLARSLELTESLSDFGTGVRRHLGLK